MQTQPSSMSDRRTDRSPEGPKQRDALRALLELPLLAAIHRLANNGDFDRSTLREELQYVCAAAKRSGIQAEQVLIAVKEIWAALPIARAVEQRAEGKPFFSQVVTMTLDEYYDTSNRRD